jgi:hypothetical protein
MASSTLRTPKNNYSQIFKPSVESDKGNISWEAHLQSSKTNRGSYLDPAVPIFVQIYEFYLVPLTVKQESSVSCAGGGGCNSLKVLLAVSISLGSTFNSQV